MTEPISLHYMHSWCGMLDHCKTYIVFYLKKKMVYKPHPIMVRTRTDHLDSKVHKNVDMKTCFFGKMIGITLLKFSSQYVC